MSDEKVIVFTHAIDIDGFGCAVLAKLAYKNPKIVYVNYSEVDDIVAFAWSKDELYDYDKIFVTDVSLNLGICKLLDEDSRLKGKVQILDHHESCVGKITKYSWVNVTPSKDGKTCCGTSLFYEYLVKQGLLEKTSSRDKFVEFTRIQDTDWKHPDFEEAHLLDTLSMAIGREQYVDNMTEKLGEQVFELDKSDKKAILKYLKAYNKQINRYLSEIQIVDFDGLKAGYVEILNIYRSNLAKAVKESPLAENLDILILPIIDDNKVSFRAINPNCDVAKVAEGFGGGGHPYAASAPKDKFKLDNENE